MFDQDQGLLTSDDNQSVIVRPNFLLSLMMEGEYSKIIELFKEIDTTIYNFFVLVKANLQLRLYKKARDYLDDVKALVKENTLALAYWHYLWSCYLTYGGGTVTEAVKEANHALKLLDDVKDTQWVLSKDDIAGNINIILAVQNNSLGNYSKARSCLMKAKEIFERSDAISDYSRAIHQLGITEYLQGNYEEALELYEEALLYREQLGNPIEISHSFYAISRIYIAKGELQAAVDYLKNAQELLENLGRDESFRAPIIASLGDIAKRQGKLSTALQYYNEGLGLVSGDDDNQPWKANILLEISCTQRLQADTEKALENLTEAQGLFQSLGMVDGVAHIQFTRALVFEDRGFYEKAREELQKALSLYIDINRPVYVASSLIELAFLEYKIGSRSIREAVEPRFPFFQSDNPVIHAYSLMLKGLTEIEEKNYGSAWNFFIDALNCKALVFLDRIKCYEALIDLALLDWKNKTTEENFQKLHFYLNKLESDSTKENLSPIICKIYLIKAKIDQARTNLTGAKKWIAKCLDHAENNGLPGYVMIARMEMDKLEELEKTVHEEIITSMAQKTDMSPEIIRNYFQSFMEEIAKNSRDLRPVKPEKEDISAVSAKKIETMNQVKEILRVLEENPLGVYQKDLPEMIGLSKATISRRLHELLNQDKITSILKERTRLVMLKAD